MGRYRDILITGDDIALDVGGNPVFVTDRASVAQDIMHMIRESGLLVELVGNRDKAARQANIVKITLAVDQDVRIIPGTAKIEEVALGEFWLYAKTVAESEIALAMNT